MLVILKTPYGRIIEVKAEDAVKRMRQGCVKLGKLQQAEEKKKRTRKLKI